MEYHIEQFLSWISGHLLDSIASVCPVGPPKWGVPTIPYLVSFERRILWSTVSNVFLQKYFYVNLHLSMYKLGLHLS